MGFAILIGVMALLLASFALGQSIKNMMDIERMKDRQQMVIDEIGRTLKKTKEKHEGGNK